METSTDLFHDESLTHEVRKAARLLRLVWSRRSLLVVVMSAACLLGGLYHLTADRVYESEGTILVVAPQPDKLGMPLAVGREDLSSMATCEKLIASPLILQAAARHLDGPARYGLGGHEPDELARLIGRRLTARMVLNTNLISLRFKSSDPQVAHSVLESVIRAYADFMRETHRGTGDHLIDVLTKEKVEIDGKLRVAEADYLQIRRDVGDVSAQGDGKLVHPMVERAMQLNAALIDAQKKRLLLQASLESLQQAVDAGENVRESLISIEESLGGEVFRESVGGSGRSKETRLALEKQLLEDRAQLETLGQYLGDNHPKVIERRAKVTNVEEYLAQFDVLGSLRQSATDDAQLATTVIQVLAQRVASAQKHEQWLQQNFDQAKQESIDLSGQMARLDIVSHDIKWLRQLRSTILDQIASVDLRQHQGGVKVTVVQEPSVPIHAVSPHAILTALVTLSAGLGIGLTIIFIVDALDDRIRSADELVRQCGMPLLATLGELPVEIDRPDDGGQGLHRVQMWEGPDDASAESFRTLRTVIAMHGDGSQRLAISSAEPNDGKTTVSTNLAVAYHQAGKRVLLIDGDMRKPGLTRLTGFRSRPGLSDLLRDSRPVADMAAEMTHRSGDVPIDIIPSGKRPANPGELLLGDRLSELLAWAETVYDQIIVDAPPAIAGTDAAAIGRACEGLVLVVRPAFNRRRSIVQAVETLRGMGTKLHGIVINGVGMAVDTFGYGYAYEYGYGESDSDTDVDEESTDADASVGFDEVVQPTLPHPILRRSAA